MFQFSPWLAAGCLSPRRIFWEIKKYEAARVANNSTYWVIFELLWRDYFRFVCQKFGDRVFYKSGILNKDIHWSQDKAKFRAWAEGNTGVPFVDANMRELKMVSTSSKHFVAPVLQSYLINLIVLVILSLQFCPCSDWVHVQPRPPERGQLPGEGPGAGLEAGRRVVRVPAP